MGRKILAVFVGWVVAAAVMLLGQMLMATLWSPPPTAVWGDEAMLREYIDALPTAAFIALAAIYAVAAFAGGFIVTKMARRVSPGPTLPIVLATILFVGGLFNFFVALPYHPVWVTLLCLALYYPLALLGHRFAR